MASGHNLTFLNRVDVPTFQKGASQSWIDLTMATAVADPLIQAWSVRNEETLRLHKYVQFIVDPRSMTARVRNSIDWTVDNPSLEALRARLRNGLGRDATLCGSFRKRIMLQ